MSRIKTLAKETAIYGVSSILGRMLNWLLVPVYTQFLKPSAYGIVTELYAYVAFLVILYTFGLETAFFRYATREDSNEKDIFNLSQTSIIVSSLILSTLLILFAGPIVQYLEYPGMERYVVWFALILGIDAISAIPFARLRLKGLARRFAVIKLTYIFINIGLNLFFIVFCTRIMSSSSGSSLQKIIGLFFNEEHLVDYIFLSNLIASSSVLLLLSDVIFGFKISIDKKLLQKMYRYSLPIMVMGLAGVTNEMLSRAVLKKWLPDGFYEGYTNQAALGIFGAAYKLSVFMTLVIQAFRYAAEPFFFSRAKDLDSKELFGRVMHWFIIFAVVVMVTISLNLDIIGKLFLRSPEYRDGLIVVPVLLLANLFLGIYYNLSVWFKLTDRTYYGTIISVSGALITIILNYVLIPVSGYFGSSLATLSCYLFMTILSFGLGKKYYNVPYDTGKALLYIILGVLITYVGYYPNKLLPGNNKIIQLILIAVFLIFIFFNEKKNLKNLLQGIRKKK